MKKVLIYGAYGMDNLGDDYMMKCIDEKLLSEGLQPIYFKRNHESYYFEDCKNKEMYEFPLELKYKSKLRKIIQTLKWYWKTDDLKEIDALIFMGGGYINEQFGIENIIKLYILTKKFKNKKIYFTGQSVGPVYSKFGKKIIKKIYESANAISVRETVSYDYLKKIGLKVNLVGDDAFLDKSFNDVQKAKKKHIIFNCKDFDKYEDFKESYFEFLLKIAKKEKDNIIIMPFRSSRNSNEYKINKELANYLEENEIVCNFVVNRDFSSFNDLFHNARFVVGTAYHSIVLGLKNNSKVFSFYSGDYYKMKIEGILDWYDISKKCSKDMKNIKNVDLDILENYDSNVTPDITKKIQKSVDEFWNKIIKEVLE